MKRGTLLILLAVVLVFAAALFLAGPRTNLGTAQAGEKVVMCHWSEDEECWVTIEVSVNAVPAHEAHGDILGPCTEETCEDGEEPE